MAGGKDDIGAPPEVQETEGHSPPDDPPPSISNGPEWPRPGYAKRFWTKDPVPEIIMENYVVKIL